MVLKAKRKIKNYLIVLFIFISFSESSLKENRSLEEKDKFCFIFLHDNKSSYDLNFYNAAEEVCKELNVEFVPKVNVPESEECYNIAKSLAEDGCKGIFADSFSHEDYLIKAAKEYPNIQFGHATGTKAHTEKLDNFHNAFASIYEGRYISGVVAGMKLNEMIKDGKINKTDAKVGYVGAFPYAEVVSGYTAFFLGVKSECDSATMDVRYTNSWYDEEGEKNTATKLIDEDKCVLISQHADSQGAPSVCEEKKVPNVFYNMENLNLNNSYLASSRINWKPYFKYFIENTKNGTKMDYDWTGNISNGAVEILKLGNISTPGTQEKIDSVISDLKSGNLKVFDTSKFTVSKETPNLEVDSNKHITSYKADVDSDENYTGDTEVVSDGYFHESEKRSAPYFDLRIDGINEIFEDEKDDTTNIYSTYSTNIDSTYIASSTQNIGNYTNTNYANTYRGTKKTGLSAGAICAIIIPCSLALLGITIAALTLNKKGSNNIGNVPMGGSPISSNYIGNAYENSTIQNFPVQNPAIQEIQA